MTLVENRAVDLFFASKYLDVCISRRVCYIFCRFIRQSCL